MMGTGKTITQTMYPGQSILIQSDLQVIGWREGSEPAEEGFRQTCQKPRGFSKITH